ncbi:hypothetical protein [Microterricola viridarii]|uniref:Uncharacterized protein n=1 Tax=Microterricola viridarii TaxID=412690 RepID=A0A1H1YLJ5_9MICO|nr:hypothetical protein [Microterricola viridarii]SDT22225.1 hypothetical protein SAMN04489834_3127 [Microterricola viridarii]
MSDNEARDKAWRGYSGRDGRINPSKDFRAGYDAAKAEPLTIDRDAMATVIREAMSDADIDGYGYGYGDEGAGYDFTIVADAVIAHLSAQEAATEDEWEYRSHIVNSLQRHAISERTDAETAYVFVRDARPGERGWVERRRQAGNVERVPAAQEGERGA